MAFLALGLLARVVPARPSRHRFGGFHRLGIDTPGAGQLTTPSGDTYPAAEPSGQPFGQATRRPAGEERVHRRVWREIDRQGTPLDAVAGHISDRVECRAQVVDHRPARHGDEFAHHRPRLTGQDPPFGVGEV